MPYIPALKYHFLTPFYDNFIRFTMPEKRFKADLVNLAACKNGRILDYGCGTATLTIALKSANKMAKVIGIEVDKNIFRQAENKRKQFKSDIELLFYDGSKIPFEDNSFDLITASFVFDHLTIFQKIHSLHEIFRVLKPKGVFLIADWGKPKNQFMRFLFLVVQVIDNFKTTADLVEGKLPNYLKHSGFSDIRICKNYTTIFGNFEILRAVKA